MAQKNFTPPALPVARRPNVASQTSATPPPYMAVVNTALEAELSRYPVLDDFQYWVDLHLSKRPRYTPRAGWERVTARLSREQAAEIPPAHFVAVTGLPDELGGVLVTYWRQK